MAKSGDHKRPACEPSERCDLWGLTSTASEPPPVGVRIRVSSIASPTAIASSASIRSISSGLLGPSRLRLQELGLGL
jgi:hypothetical protein